MKSPRPADEKALTGRSLLVALLMSLLWTLGACFMAVHASVHVQQMLMVLFFGAILTVFLLQFRVLFLVTVVGLWAGAFVVTLITSNPADRGEITLGYLRSLVVVVPLTATAVWLQFRPLRRGELAVVYAAVVIAIPWCITIKAVIESSTANLFEVHRESEPQLYSWARELPWWGPTIPPAANPALPPTLPSAAGKPALTPDEAATREAVAGFTRGNGGNVPWGMWWRPILYWSAICTAFEAMLMGLLLTMRKRFVENERLPFVWAQPALTIIQGPAEGERTRYRWVLFLIGLSLCLPATLYVSPTGESLSSWICPPWAGVTEQRGIRGGVDLTDLNILPGVTLQLLWGPLVLTMFLLLPVDVLMTVALTYIVLNILLPGVMTSLGLTVGAKYVSGFVKTGLRFGGGVGLLVWSLWFNRKTFWGYVRSLWGGKPTDGASADEIPRPLVLLLFVGGTVAFIALGCYATTTGPIDWSKPYSYSGLIQMIVLTALIVVFAFSQVRQRIEGMPLSYDNNFGSHMMVSVQRDFLHDHYGLAAHDPNIPVSGHSWSINWMQWGFNGQLKSFGPHNMLLEAFKIGHELRVHARQIAWVILLAMLLVALVTPLLYLKLMYVYGFENSFQEPLTTWASFTQWAERGASYGLHSTSQFFRYTAATNFYDRYKPFFHIVYGVAIVGGLFYLRREYPRFPFSPVGVVIASETWTAGHGMPFSPSIVWFSFLVAWIVKSLMFRWLGVRSFREKIQPGVIFLLCGMIFGMMVYMFRQLTLLRGCLK